MRTRIYKTARTKHGGRVIQSGTASEWAVYGLIKGLCKMVFYVCFFWIIIPVKLLSRKK